MANLDPVTPDNQDPITTTGTVTPPTFSWKQNLTEDLRNSPIAQKFSDDINGLNASFKSHANLEQLLGHEKVPIPKDDNDTEGWARFSKAMGIPDVADGYGLQDPEIDPSIKEVFNFDKQQFSEICHGFKLTPNQAKGLWQTYVNKAVEDYTKQVETEKQRMAKTVNALRGEWGDGYEGNVHLGQMVINKFSGGDKEMESFLTAALARDPRGVKFLAKIGSNFAENKIGEFSATRFSLAPEQAKEEIEKILADPNHPYLNEKATPQEHQAAVDYVNRLYMIANKKPF